MRERFLEDQPVNRRRARSDAEAQGSQQRPYDTKDGAKARQIDLERRVADLERDWNVPMDDQEPSGGGGPAVIDMGDSDVYTGYSKTYYPLDDVTLDSIVAAVDSAGTTDTIANAYKGNTLLGTVTIPAGDLLSDPLEPSESFTDSDYWQMLVTQAGSGASGLTFYGAFS